MTVAVVAVWIGLEGACSVLFVGLADEDMLELK